MVRNYICLRCTTTDILIQMATLSVQEAMGFKVDREAVATLVLPQLWTMSMGLCMWSIFSLSFALMTFFIETNRILFQY